MPVYNSAKYLTQAINSVITQTFIDWELIIINDASTDNSEELIKKFTDSRIKLIVNKKNLGLSGARNVGLAQANGEYVAFLDSDDYWLPAKLEKQISFLDQHPEVGLCGTQAVAFGDKQKPKTMHCFFNPNLLECLILFVNPFITSTVVLRRKILVDNGLFFDLNYTPTEDYEFWDRISRFAKIANLKGRLSYYRFHPEQTSKHLKSMEQVQKIIGELHSRQFNKIGLALSERDLELSFSFLRHQQIADTEDVECLLNLLSRMKKFNDLHKKYASDYFDQAVGVVEYLTLIKSFRHKKKFVKNYVDFLLKKNIFMINKLKFVVKFIATYLKPVNI